MFFFCCFLFRPNGIFIARHLRHLFVTSLSKTLSLRWLTWSELHSQSSHLKLLPKMFSSRSCLKFRGVQWWQKWNLFNSYGGNFRRHFGCLSFARRPHKKCAQFVLKLAHLAISMAPIPLLEKVSSYGLLPLLWLLASQNFLAVETFNEMKKNFASRNASIKIRNEVYDSILSG